MTTSLYIIWSNDAWLVGASIVKWTTLDPCLGSSQSDSKLYSNLELCEEKVHRHSLELMIYKAKQLIMAKIIPSRWY